MQLTKRVVVVTLWSTCNDALQSPGLSLSCMQLLGLDRTASWQEVKAAYKRLALHLHPDKQKGATLDQAAAVAQMFQEVAEARDVLSNEDQRAAYDRVRDYMVRSRHT